MKNLPKKIRSKKLNTRVDLTAMVSVSFLLIVFFMLVGELSKSKVMEFDLPRERGCGSRPIVCFDENRIYTILLDKNNKIVTYSGLLGYLSEAPKKIGYGKDGIRKELLNKQKAIFEYSAEIGNPGRGITVIIKPSKKCNYKNLVDILDEMAIADISSYVIVNDFTAEESKLLALR